jgi:TDG/mug DNA glycosylase family protein
VEWSTDTPSAVPDVLAPGLAVVFVGINPGFHSDAKAAHFANPRNDFWRLLHAAGFTPRLVEPSEQFEVLRYGVGITNAAYRTTRGSSDLRRSEFVGKEAYRGPFGGRPRHGLQEPQLGETALFVLPSTSPANAAVPWDERLRWFAALRELIP